MYFTHNDRTFESDSDKGPRIINRAFSYGDGFFETLRFSGGRILHAEHHMERMLDTAMQFRLRFREKLSSTLLGSKIKSLARLNGHDEARVRITVYRSGSGYYHPESMASDMLIQTWKLDEAPYPDHPAIGVDISKDIRLSPNIFSALKTIGRHEQVIASLECRERHLDDLLLLNNSGILAEAISSNVFVMIDGVLYLPEEGLGQVKGIMQGIISHLAAANGIKVNRSSMTSRMLDDASEIFLTNTLKGVVPVGQFAGRSLDTMTCRSLQRWLRDTI